MGILENWVLIHILSIIITYHTLINLMERWINLTSQDRIKNFLDKSQVHTLNDFQDKIHHFQLPVLLRGQLNDSQLSPLDVVPFNQTLWLYFYLFMINIKMPTLISISILFQIYLFLTSIYQTSTIPYLSAPPVWLTSDYFRAGNENVINTLTGSSSTPQYVFTFSSPLPGIPKLAYGIKNYKGNDYFGQERFEVRRVDLTAATFKVAVQIYGVTNIHILNVPYIAIDPTFPHHLNSFDNVPLNYNNGPLTNITSKHPTQVLTYTNMVNYPAQATGMTYTKFKKPLENNRILLYIMALDIFGSNSQTSYPIDLRVSAAVLSEETYELKATLSYNVQITLIHFSQIMFDEEDVKSSNKYFIVTEYYDIGQKGGFIEIPEEFKDNFILGLTDFTTKVGKAALYYNWQYITLANGTFGVQIEESIPLPSLFQQALIRQGTMAFYIMTWQCPPHYDYFNLTSRLCQEECGEYSFEVALYNSCKQCYYSCYDCSIVNNQYLCLTCNTNTDNRELTVDKACLCSPGFYELQGNKVCQSCESIIHGCIDCFHNSTYDSADAVLGAIQIGCLECSPDKFLINNLCVSLITCTGTTVLNKDTNTCVPCHLDGCITCDSITECLICDQSIQHFLNNETKQCQKCSIDFCDLCQDINRCSTCLNSFILQDNQCICPSEGQFIDVAGQKCMNCSSYCKTCTGPTAHECTSCFEQYHRILFGGQCLCDPYNYKEAEQTVSSLKCQIIDETKCGYGEIYLKKSKQCVSLCGDGIVLEEECDDGNILNIDGCSSRCQIEQEYQCNSSKGHTSVCKFIGQIQIIEMFITKSESQNSLEFMIDIGPDSLLFYNYNFTQILEFHGAELQITEAVYQSGKLYISTNYDNDITDSELSLAIKDSFYFDPRTPPINNQTLFNTSKPTFQIGRISDPSIAINGTKFQVKTTNNLEVYHYSISEYEANKNSEQVVTGVVAVGLITAGLTLFLKNSLSTLFIVSNLQICFIGITSVDGLNPVNRAIINAKPVLGYNQLNIEEQKLSKISTRVSILGFENNLVNNVNIMFFGCIGFMIITLVFYISQLKKESMGTAFKVMQRETMLLIIFNLPNLFFSLAIFMEIKLISLIFSLVFLIIVLFQCAHLLLYTQTYLGVQSTFNTGKKYYKVSIVSLIVGRLISCMALGQIEEKSEIGVGIVMAAYGLILMILLVSMPFLYMISNILVVLGELITIFYFTIIIVMQHNDKSTKWVCGWMMVGALCGIAATGLANLGYCIYKDCANNCSQETQLRD